MKKPSTHVSPLERVLVSFNYVVDDCYDKHGEKLYSNDDLYEKLSGIEESIRETMELLEQMDDEMDFISMESDIWKEEE